MERASKKKKNGLKPDRAEAFEEYFAGLYGQRWPALKAALLKDPRQAVLKNPFSENLQDYRLDEASLLPAQFMEVEAGQSVADFCASPGGKSLAMIFGAKSGDESSRTKWFLNDLSPGRVQRLKAVMHDCLPEEILEQVHITKSDASRWGLQRKGHFDRVLVDAPCSGERHLMESPKELSRWSLKGAKRLVIRQHSLLCAAFDSLDQGGRLVYSTCSINPIENDGVVERLLESREGQFDILRVKASIGEPTAHGWIVLPDKFDCGPIYFSVIQKHA